MEDVDFVKGWLELKAYIGSKRGHGQDDLLAEMSRIEVECSSSTYPPMARPREGAGEGKQHRQEGPPSDEDASASSTDEPSTTHPPKEENHNGRSHRDTAGAR